MVQDQDLRNLRDISWATTGGLNPKKCYMYKLCVSPEDVRFNLMFAVYRGSGNSDNAQFGGKNSRLQTKVALVSDQLDYGTLILFGANSSLSSSALSRFGQLWV
ncbi:hypothetical protein [Coleofasciculus sp. H7-2]|uniref:hypothetical protein n=1 Tax=Coleofasciculus sp. H7-2 TaxID=3351545 RepID=UPI00366D7094